MNVDEINEKVGLNIQSIKCSKVIYILDIYQSNEKAIMPSCPSCRPSWRPS